MQVSRNVNQYLITLSVRYKNSFTKSELQIP
jgi:hypothetical protein